MDEYDDTSNDEHGEFGPGMDMALSLLAVCILLIAVIGISLDRQSIDQEVIFSLEWKALGPKNFKIGSYRLPSGTESVLLAKIDNLESALKNSKANHILISGYASPEPDWKQRENGKLINCRDLENTRKCFDYNLTLSALRATEVANFLSHTGNIPTHCLSATGFGRGRSAKLHDGYLAQSGHSLATWDKSWSSGYQVDNKWHSGLAVERKVDVLLVYDPNSYCDHDSLINSIASRDNGENDVPLN